MGFDSAPRLTNTDKRQLAEHHAPSGYLLSSMHTVSFNFIKCVYVNAWAAGEPIRTITKWVHNRTVIMETLLSGGVHINAYDSATTRKKLSSVLPSGLHMVVVNYTQWLVDTSKSWELAEWHQGDDFVVTNGQGGHAWEITGGDEWCIGRRVSKRGMVASNPSLGQVAL